MKKIPSRLKSFLNYSSIFLLLFFIVGCSSVPAVKKSNIDITKNLPLEYICPSTLEWTPVTNDEGQPIAGFSKMHYEMKDFRVRWTCVKADLDTPGLELVATPAPQDLGKSPRLLHVKTFAKENNAVVAINATPWKNKSYPHDAVGIVKIDGVEFYPPENNYCALCFTKTPLRAYIMKNQNAEELEKYDSAFGGFFQVLENNSLIPFITNRRSRVCAGTNKDGSELYFFIVSTIANPSDKNGFTFEECGLILQKLGCTEVMHFDGGHSSCIVINKKESQKPLLNRKIPIAIGLKK